MTKSASRAADQRARERIGAQHAPRMKRPRELMPLRPRAAKRASQWS